jgi:hypothetical protein
MGNVLELKPVLGNLAQAVKDRHKLVRGYHIRMDFV